MIPAEAIQENIKNLTGLPGQIFEKKTKLNFVNSMDPILNQLQEIMAEITFEINEEKVEGKPKFSNEKMREAEKTRRLKENKEYQELLAERQSLEEKKIMVDAEIKLLQDRLSAEKALAHLYSAVLSSGYNYAPGM